jgi:hypothetical protein
MESPLERVLRLAQVRSYERRSARGRLEQVRSYTSREGEGYIPPEKWREGQQEWEARGEAAWRRDRLPDADRQLVAHHQEDERSEAAHSEPARPGTPQHAQELRHLADEAELLRGHNFLSLRDSREGMPPASVASDKAGTGKAAPPESDAARIMRRAAQMISAGQPSLARTHAPAIREVARAEATGNPGLLARINAAADKLEALPEGKGLAAQPPENSDVRSRTAAARRYARSPIKKG